MTGQREFVLALPRNRVAVGKNLRAVTQRDVPLRGHTGIREPPAEGCGVHGLVAVGERLRWFLDDPRRSGHRLDPARHDDLGISGKNRAAALNDGLEAGAAQSIDRRAGHGCRQAREQHRHSGDVPVLLARTVGVAENDVIDRRGIERHPVDELAEDGRREVVRPDGGETAAVSPGGRTNRVVDEDCRHWTLQSNPPPRDPRVGDRG